MDTGICTLCYGGIPRPLPAALGPHDAPRPMTPQLPGVMLRSLEASWFGAAKQLLTASLHFALCSESNFALDQWPLSVDGGISSQLPDVGAQCHACA